MSEQNKAIVVGVGPEAGLGAALCKRFAREGHHVFASGRTKQQLEELAESIVAAGGQATAITADATHEADVLRLFDSVDAAGGGPLDLVVYNAGNNQWGSLREMNAEFFENVWRVGCLGGFLVGTEAARRMLPNGAGTILFTGATASIRGRPPFGAFASAKAALRSLAQTMARDFGPEGIHVAQVIIDGVIRGDKILKRAPEYADQKGEDGMLDIDAIADTYWHLHTQHRSAWSHEVDVRPFKEKW